MKKLKMDAVDIKQQEQIDSLITRLAMVSAVLVIWCICLTMSIALTKNV